MAIDLTVHSPAARPSERRRHIRIPVQGTAVTPSDEEWRLQDISRGGAYLSGSRTPDDAEVIVDIPWVPPFVVGVRVVRSDSEGYRVSFFSEPKELGDAERIYGLLSGDGPLTDILLLNSHGSARADIRAELEYLGHHVREVDTLSAAVRELLSQPSIGVFLIEQGACDGAISAMQDILAEQFPEVDIVPISAPSRQEWAVVEFAAGTFFD